jgi:hypothetical protein
MLPSDHADLESASGQVGALHRSFCEGARRREVMLGT